jgi:hypothetical protein
MQTVHTSALLCNCALIQNLYFAYVSPPWTVLTVIPWSFNYLPCSLSSIVQCDCQEEARMPSCAFSNCGIQDGTTALRVKVPVSRIASSLLNYSQPLPQYPLYNLSEIQPSLCLDKSVWKSITIGKKRPGRCLVFH